MPRFYFHSSGEVPFQDREGTELASIYAARREAVVLAGEILRFMPEAALAGEFRVEVRLDQDRPVFAVKTTVENLPA